jgi:Uncharacterized protein conserved in bacteria
MSAKRLDFRFQFLLEELIELDAAIEAKDAPGVVDAIIDLVVVAVGALNEAGVDGQKAWDEVLRANMEKVPGHNASRADSGGFDLVKPAGWEPPDHSDNVGQLINAFSGERTMPYSITALLQAASLQLRKHSDYNDNIQRGEYWIHGMDSFEYELNKKHLRFRSILSKARRGVEANFESLEDNLLDKIVYAALALSWLRHREPGQSADRDLFNKPTSR